MEGGGGPCRRRAGGRTRVATKQNRRPVRLEEELNRYESKATWAVAARLHAVVRLPARILASGPWRSPMQTCWALLRSKVRQPSSPLPPPPISTLLARGIGVLVLGASHGRICHRLFLRPEIDMVVSSPPAVADWDHADGCRSRAGDAVSVHYGSRPAQSSGTSKADIYSGAPGMDPEDHEAMRAKKPGRRAASCDMRLSGPSPTPFSEAEEQSTGAVRCPSSGYPTFLPGPVMLSCYR